MDIFYYWKNIDDDLRAGRIGWLKSERQKLGELKERNPTNIWAFKTPVGCKGQLQLLAKLVWSDTPAVDVPKLDVNSMIFYDYSHKDTIFYSFTDTVEAIEGVTKVLRVQFPVAFRSNFQGDNGIQIMDGDFLRQFKKLADNFSGTPLPILSGKK